MKNLFFTAFLMDYLLMSCSDDTRNDPLALNLGIDDNCQDIRATF